MGGQIQNGEFLLSMSAIGVPDARDLRTAVRDCNERGLMVAARWAAEQLMAIPAELRPADQEQITEEECAQSDLFALGRCYMEQKEFARAAHLLKKAQGPKAAFVRSYA